MNLDTLVLSYMESGYSARGGTLYAPNGYEVRGVIKSGDDAFLPETLADAIEGMQHAAFDKRGKRSLKGLVLTTAPMRFR